jgi:hypothetical protein
VQRYVAVIDVDSDVIDVKTAGKKPSGVHADYRVQVPTYAMPALARLGERGCKRSPAESGPGLYSDDRRHRRGSAHASNQIAHEGMRSGLYAPNRSSFLDLNTLSHDDATLGTLRPNRPSATPRKSLKRAEVTPSRLSPANGITIRRQFCGLVRSAQVMSLT